MYITIAKSSYKTNNEIFKKFFAKNIGLELIHEKVKVVKIDLARLCNKVNEGFSKSMDKLRNAMKQE